MAHRIKVCLELKNRIFNYPNFIKPVITDDETWVYGCNPETKAQSLQ